MGIPLEAGVSQAVQSISVMLQLKKRNQRITFVNQSANRPETFMDQENLRQFLQRTNLVGPLKAGEIASQFTREVFGKQALLLKAGKVANEYFFLEKGFTRAFAFDTNGNDVTPHFYAGNQGVFEVCSFF